MPQRAKSFEPRRSSRKNTTNKSRGRSAPAKLQTQKRSKRSSAARKIKNTVKSYIYRKSKFKKKQKIQLIDLSGQIISEINISLPKNLEVLKEQFEVAIPVNSTFYYKDKTIELTYKNLRYLWGLKDVIELHVVFGPEVYRTGSAKLYDFSDIDSTLLNHTVLSIDYFWEELQGILGK